MKKIFYSIFANFTFLLNVYDSKAANKKVMEENASYPKSVRLFLDNLTTHAIEASGKRKSEAKIKTDSMRTDDCAKNV